MATLTVQTAPADGTGIVPTLNAADSGGDQFTNNGRTVLWIENAHASASRTITITEQGTCDRGYSHTSDYDIVVTAGEDRRVAGPFNKGRFNDSSDFVQVTYSDSAADITVAVLSL